MPLKKHNSKKNIPKIKQDMKPIPKIRDRVTASKTGVELIKRVTSITTSGKKKKPAG